MNKKFAALLFAIGLGVSASPAVLASCKGDCLMQYNECVAETGDTVSCGKMKTYCQAQCSTTGG